MLGAVRPTRHRRTGASGGVARAEGGRCRGDPKENDDDGVSSVPGGEPRGGAILSRMRRTDVFAQEGQVEAGLAALAEALATAQATGERWAEAELYRLRGSLLLQTGAPKAEAEAWLQRALDVARRQEAKSLELRAAMSLSRLWQQQGKRREAHDLLAGIYAWFTEGFDTADLQEAKALLKDLV